MPFRVRLIGSTLATLGPRLGDALARPVLWTAEQLDALRSLVPNNRYTNELRRYQWMCLLYTDDVLHSSTFEKKHKSNI